MKLSFIVSNKIADKTEEFFKETFGDDLPGLLEKITYRVADTRTDYFLNEEMIYSIWYEISDERITIYEKKYK